MNSKFVNVRDRDKDRDIHFDLEQVEAITFQWTGKKDYSQYVHAVEIFLKSGNSVHLETNDDGKDKIEKALKESRQ